MTNGANRDIPWKLLALLAKLKDENKPVIIISTDNKTLKRNGIIVEYDLVPYPWVVIGMDFDNNKANPIHFELYPLEEVVLTWSLSAKEIRELNIPDE